MEPVLQGVAGESAGMRGVRDQVLALLLSSGKPGVSIAQTPTPHTPAAWTPGARLLASPVTPINVSTTENIPSSTHVRLAEVTAGLVAASDKERRQTDTIRKLALQLERSEQQHRASTRRRRPKSTGRSISRSTSPGPRDDRDRRKDPQSERQRNKERDHCSDRGRDNDSYRDSGRGRSQSRRSERLDYERQRQSLEREVAALRLEKREWAQKNVAQQEEQQNIAKLFADIRRSMRRVLDERDDHLHVIAQLQQQLLEARTAAPPPVAEEISAEHTPVPEEDIQRTPQSRRHVSALHSPREQQQAELSNPSRKRDSERTASSRRSAKAPVQHSESSSVTSHSHPRPRREPRAQSEPVFPVTVSSARKATAVPPERSLSAMNTREVEEEDMSHNRRVVEDDLRRELQSVLRENMELFENLSTTKRRCAELEASGKRLEERAETQSSAVRIANAEIERLRAEAECGTETRDIEMRERLRSLDDELRVLEGVVECMQFSIDTEDAERLQETMTTIGYEAANMEKDSGEEEYEDEDDIEEDIVGINTLTRRIGRIRCSVAQKYGKWLSELGAQNTTDNLDFTITQDTATETQDAVVLPRELTEEPTP